VKKFNMQNVIMWVIPQQAGGYKFRYRGNFQRVKNHLKLQIHNSIQLGWPKEDIIVITNFPFQHMGVKAHVLDEVCGWSAFANKLIFVNEMIKQGVINDNFWFHDADAYQLEPFNFPEECKDVGFVRHAVGRSKPQGASSFYRKEAFDIVSAIADMIKLFRPTKEESFFPAFYNKRSGEKSILKQRNNLAIVKGKIKKVKANGGAEAALAKLQKKAAIKKKMAKGASKYFGKFAERFCWLDYTYNISHQRMFTSKYRLATKPIKVLHFHTEYESCLRCYYYGINRHKVRVVDDRLEKLFLRYGFINKSKKREPENV